MRQAGSDAGRRVGSAMKELTSRRRIQTTPSSSDWKSSAS
jgi:hypothetical protein